MLYYAEMDRDKYTPRETPHGYTIVLQHPQSRKTGAKPKLDIFRYSFRTWHSLFLLFFVR